MGIQEIRGIPGGLTNDDLCQVLEIHLVADARAWRDDAKVVERLLPSASGPE